MTTTTPARPAMKSTPPRAVRLHCQWCCNGTPGTSAVKGCNSPACSLYAWRLGGPSMLIATQAPPAEPRPFNAPQVMRQRAGKSRLAAIRLRCLDCLGTAAEVKKCAATDCDPHPYRLGHNPSRAGMGRTGGNPKLTGYFPTPDRFE